MSEKKLSKMIFNILEHAGVHVQRHEDKNNAGIPDISFGFRGKSGWIELKYLKKWPARPSTPVRLKHFTAAQRHWLYERGRRCGNCFLILQVDKEFLVFGWHHVKWLDDNKKNIKLRAELILTEETLYDFIDFLY